MFCVFLLSSPVECKIQVFKSAGPACAACVLARCHLSMSWYVTTSFYFSTSTPSQHQLSWLPFFIVIFFGVELNHLWDDPLRERQAADHVASQEKAWLCLWEMSPFQNFQVWADKTPKCQELKIVRHVPVCRDYKELSRGLL